MAVFVTGGEALTSQIDEHTILLLHGEELVDRSMYGHTIDNRGVIVSANQSKFGGKSLYFDGTSFATVQIPDVFGGTGDWTVEWWEYRTAEVNNSCVFSRSANAGKGDGVLINHFYKTPNFYCMSKTAWDMASMVSMGDHLMNQWVHRAAVRSGSTIYLFQNGKIVNSILSSAAIAEATNPVYLGKYDTANGPLWGGYIDELRVSDVARWTSAFTPPTSAYS